MKKYLILSLVVFSILPQIAFASWWNPFSWFDYWNFSQKEIPKVEVVEKHTQNSENNLSTTTTVAVQANTTATSTKVVETPKKTTPVTKPTVTTPTPKPVVVETPKIQAVSPYCSVATDCSGFKVKIDMYEDPGCNKVGNPGYLCEYYDPSMQTKQVYYILVKSDTVHGEVRYKNLNSGSEEFFEKLLGDYDSKTGIITFWYGYYAYPNIMQGWISMKHTGKITNGKFIGESSTKLSVRGDATNLSISLSDEISKKDCLIKGDKSSSSGNVPTYYVTSSAGYKDINNPWGWFCNETDAINSGYQKALR